MIALLVAWMPLAAGAQEFLLVKREHRNQADAAFHSQQRCRVTHFKHIPWSVVRLPEQAAMVRENYRRSGLFERCETNRIYRTCVLPNDPFYPQLWGLHKIDAPRAWDTATRNNVIVAVIDTGVDYDHPDIAANLWSGPAGEHGYTAIGGTIVPGGKDDYSHGSHVAGIIGAVGNNGIGVAGINWGTQIASFKFLNAQGSGFTMDAALCIDKMIDLKLDGHNIRVSNNSWGRPVARDEGEQFDPVLSEAFQAAANAGILSVCAAGNDFVNTDVSPFSPSCLPVDGIISVVASDEMDDKAVFSNYGTLTTDLAAPGVEILSLATNGTYEVFSGTSMASPHVAGVAAAIFGVKPSLTVAQVKNILLHPDSLDQTAFVQTSTFGGRLNAGKALNNGLIYAPPNNRPPTITISANRVFLRSGESVTLSASGMDPDGDALRYTIFLRVTSDTLGQVYPSALVETNRITVTNFARAIAIGLEARFGVSDGKGGTALAIGDVFMEENQAFVRQVTASLSLNPIPEHPFWELFVASNVSSNDGTYALFFSSYRLVAGANCCYPANTSVPLYRGLQSGPNQFRAYLADRDGNFTTSERAFVDSGNTGIYAPEAKVSVNRTRGPAPLRVVADMSATDPRGKHGLWYYSRLWSSAGFFERSPPFSDIHNPIQTFTLTNLGITAVEFAAYDTNTALVDKVVQLFTVLPSGPILTATRTSQAMTITWTQANSSDVLEASLDLRQWFTVRAGLPPATITLTGQAAFFRLRKP